MTETEVWTRSVPRMDPEWTIYPDHSFLVLRSWACEQAYLRSNRSPKCSSNTPENGSTLRSLPGRPPAPRKQSSGHLPDTWWSGAERLVRTPRTAEHRGTVESRLDAPRDESGLPLELLTEIQGLPAQRLRRTGADPHLGGHRGRRRPRGRDTAGAGRGDARSGEAETGEKGG